MNRDSKMIFEAYNSTKEADSVSLSKTEYGQPSEEHGGKEGLSTIQLVDNGVITSNNDKKIRLKTGTILYGYWMHSAISGYGWMIIDPELGEFFISRSNKVKLLHSPNKN